MADTKKTLVEEGTEFKGTLTSTCAVVVMGRIEGELRGPSVEVTETGVLSGKAKVTELRSRGELSGDRKSTRLNSSHSELSRMPSSA